jgi:hypothetical protein
MLVCRGEVREFGLTGLTRNQVSLTAPGVRIPPSPPPSLSPFAGSPKTIEIYARAGQFARLATAETMPGPNAGDSGAFVSVAIEFRCHDETARKPE